VLHGNRNPWSFGEGLPWGSKVGYYSFLRQPAEAAVRGTAKNGSLI